MIRIPYVGSLYLLDALLENLTPYFHLYTADVDNDPGVDLADFEEADWPLYVPLRVTSWTPAVIVSGRAVSTADAALWQRGAGGPPRQVYGYYVTDTAGGPLLWWEARAQGPLPMSEPFHTVQVFPRLTLREDPDPET